MQKEVKVTHRKKCGFINIPTKIYTALNLENEPRLLMIKKGKRIIIEKINNLKKAVDNIDQL